MDEVIVKVAEGRLKGLKTNNFNGEIVYKFLGIPFAEPAVGNLRFKDAQPVKPWNGIKEAFYEGEISLQQNKLTNEIIGSEDCLTLNIFTKAVPDKSSELSPVMVWIHSGGFIMGSKDSQYHGHEYILMKNIVLVTINYRLGLMGFMNVSDSSLGINGNAGIKDQILALKWVQKNITSFNGDRNNITVFGNSAGAASIEILLLSPLAKGLFHKAIIQSGSVFNPWIFGNFCLLEFMQFIGKHCNSEKEAIDNLLTMPAKEICSWQIKYCEYKNKPLFLGTIGAKIEKEGPEALISKSPLDIFTSKQYNDVPIMIGYTSDEGLIFKLSESFENSEIEEVLREEFLQNFLPFPIADPILEKETILELKNLYFKDKNQMNKYKMAGDTQFIVGTYSSVKQFSNSRQNPTYFYRFSLNGGLNSYKRKCNINLPGICHGDELGYLFKQNIANTNMGEIELTTIKRMITLWTNFAKLGNPTPKGNNLNITWEPIDGESFRFLDIGEELAMKMDQKKLEAFRFWENTYLKQTLI